MKYRNGLSPIIHASLKTGVTDVGNCVCEFKITEQGEVALL